MPRGLGTAMQVLAGAFGGGATSLGQSRVDQGRIDTQQARQDARYRVEDSQWERDFKADQERARQEHEARMEAQRAERAYRNRVLDISGGLTPDQNRKIREMMGLYPEMSYEEARQRVVLSGAARRGTPAADRSSRVRPPVNRPGAVVPATPAPRTVPPVVRPDTTTFDPTTFDPNRP